MNKIILNLTSFLFYLLNLMICKTLKYKVSNEPPCQALFAFWHGKSFPLFYWGRHRKVCLFPTHIWRGKIVEFLAKHYNYHFIEFPEKGNPLEVSKNLEKILKIIKEGYDVAIAVDGPPYPLIFHKAKPGILFLSQKTGIPIVPVGVKIKKKIRLFWRWDRYEIPLPWSEIEINFGTPFIANEKSTPRELEQSLEKLSGGEQNVAGLF